MIAWMVYAALIGVLDRGRRTRARATRRRQPAGRARWRMAVGSGARGRGPARRADFEQTRVSRGSVVRASRPCRTSPAGDDPDGEQTAGASFRPLRHPGQAGNRLRGAAAFAWSAGIGWRRWAVLVHRPVARRTGSPPLAASDQVDGTDVYVSRLLRPRPGRDRGAEATGRRSLHGSWRLEPAARATILRHEQEHARARDHLTLLYAGLVLQQLFPWNPAIWWMCRRLRAAVELDCDQRSSHREFAPPTTATCSWTRDPGPLAAGDSPRR